MVQCLIEETFLNTNTHSLQTVISVVIPAFNEEARLGRTLRLLEEFAPMTPLEIIVVCDGCTDQTQQIASRWSQRLPLRVIAYPENRGKGYAVRQGVLEATGQIIAFMDADGATPPSELLRLTDIMISSHADIVIGSRKLGDTVVKRQPFCRHLLGKVFSVVTSLILSLPYKDTQCGFKLFGREHALDLFENMTWYGYEFDLDILFRATRSKLNVLEIGVAWTDQPGSRVSPISDGFKLLRALFLIRMSYISFAFQNIIIQPLTGKR